MSGTRRGPGGECRRGPFVVGRGVWGPAGAGGCGQGAEPGRARIGRAAPLPARSAPGGGGPAAQGGLAEVGGAPPKGAGEERRLFRTTELFRGHTTATHRIGPNNHTAHQPLRIAACLASRARRSHTSHGWRVWS
ncbi:hypothetical protein GCM10010329_54520 [Streptomyces spiroverticillatus]|uniref:Uncharacterized protein n=1 Tax=Streptomyces finlayi TaxID=67296 RepID=A0A918X2K3_9ACTN|nr:hypothetical protein GCM10010329_54520 [Streptomyces spiroverticillatus]GHD05974.1 hypothetical protein GCM10010334_57280 [Streptomyces finlayi]